MRTEDVLKATWTGLWRWDSATGASTVDLFTAHLLGVPIRRTDRGSLPLSVEGPGSDSAQESAQESARQGPPEAPSASGPEPGADPGTETLTLSETVVRARIQVSDYVDLMANATLSLTEWTMVESVMRVVDEHGSMVRTVRVRMMPTGEGESLALIGTISEVPEPASPPAARPVTQVRDQQISREAFMLNTGRTLAEARTTADVLRVAGSLAMPGFTPRALAVFNLEGDRLTLVGSHGQRPVPHHLLPFIEMSVEADHPAAAVVRTGRAIYLHEPADYRRRFPDVWPEVERVGNRAWAFLPLSVSNRTLGTWMIAFADPLEFTADERSMLTNVARMLAQAIARTSMHETELQLSAGLQRTMRPATRPGIAGMALAARYVPSGGGLEVGGDWYDVIPLPSGRTALVIGDVQGHDVRAAGIMAQLRIALRAYAAEGHRPDAVLARTSRFLAGMGRLEPRGENVAAEGFAGDNRFATCLYMEADPVTGTLDIARAGHPDPALWLADGTMLIRPTAGGLPLGIEPGTEYPTTRLVLEPGETLLVCTDGLIEAGGHTMDSGWRRIRKTSEEQTEGARAPEDLERFADALVHPGHIPLSGEEAGPLTDRREDDMALLLVALDPTFAAERAAAATGVARRTTLSVAQAEPDRIGEARHQLQGMLFDWANEDQIDAAVLMLSEMLTNVLVHTDGDARVVAECSGTRGDRLLRVEVGDTSDALPLRRTPGELASSGRGLVMMEMLAGAWGVDPRGEGKSIWFEMREDGNPNWA
ncbi:ATP-binding SpoIIE family protein phosphatase [Streptomyces albidus (ex Kaewkla and Franco 2022)]|uniref:ATP-binding SpoIIE family protein phosphatase n=1 Tax=Streptomyces albidus (ex Kaewkla and Franco 2022) TaxID=722709 RepID=UPI001F2FEC76|nr:SpoIIE family protein phosphatase [Streptomyces albidus (ex Kaewkla and Franco 2022)]